MRGTQRLARLQGHLTGGASASEASGSTERPTKLVVADTFFAPQAEKDAKGIFAGELCCDSHNLAQIGTVIERDSVQTSTDFSRSSTSVSLQAWGATFQRSRSWW